MLVACFLCSSLLRIANLSCRNGTACAVWLPIASYLRYVCFALMPRVLENFFIACLPLDRFCYSMSSLLVELSRPWLAWANQCPNLVFPENPSLLATSARITWPTGTSGGALTHRVRKARPATLWTAQPQSTIEKCQFLNNRDLPSLSVNVTAHPNQRFILYATRWSLRGSESGRIAFPRSVFFSVHH